MIIEFALPDNVDNAILAPVNYISFVSEYLKFGSLA